MNSLEKIAKEIEEIAKGFNGEIALKNGQRQYAFVNERWLEMTGLEKKDVMGKLDAEFFVPAISMQMMMEDKKALENKLPREYIGKINFSNSPLIRIVMKWAVTYDSGNLFCICTLSVKPENKRIIYDVREKIDALFEKVSLR